MLPEYKKYVDVFFDSIRLKKQVVFDEDLYQTLFISSKVDKVKSRQSQWINDYVEEYYFDMERMNDVFQIIYNSFSNDKIKYLIKFIDLAKNLHTFENLSLFPYSASWTGSEVPLIDNKIEYIKELNSRLSGIRYFDFKNYLKMVENDLVKARIKVQLQEKKEENYI